MFEPAPFNPRRAALVAPVRVDRTGRAGPTPGQARGPHWRTTSFGFHVPAIAVPKGDQRTVEAAAILREGEAVTGWAALHWQGAAWFDGTANGGRPRDVPIVVGRHVAAQPGFRISREFLAPYDILVIDGVPITQSVRSVIFEMRYAAHQAAAVRALDMACFSDLVTLVEVGAFLAAAGPITGIQQARDALAEGDENAWSPRETDMRGVWTRRAGLPRPLCNAPIFTLDGRHVGTADLIDPALGIAGEYNGSLHLSGSQVAKDLKKEASFRDLGLETITMVAADSGDLDDFARRLRSAAARAASRTTAPGWTVETPNWWTPTATVAQRRALADWQREKFLRYRRAA
jgi:hypothetical protein